MPENVITEIFNLEIGKGKVVSGDQKSYILRLKNVSEADLSTDNAKLLISQIKIRLTIAYLPISLKALQMWHG